MLDLPMLECSGAEREAEAETTYVPEAEPETEAGELFIDLHADILLVLL